MSLPFVIVGSESKAAAAGESGRESPAPGGDMSAAEKVRFVLLAQ